MQTLFRLSLQHQARVRAGAAWLAIAAILGALPGPVFARAACAPRAAVCSACHRAEASHTAGSVSCALAMRPCCGCTITSDPPPAAPPSALVLECPAPQGHGLDAFVGTAGFTARTPMTAQRLAASGPPRARPTTPASPTILRL